MLKIDYSKAVALHNLYGHYVFVMQAQKSGKDDKFISNICKNLKCVGKSNDWRNHIDVKVGRL